MRRLDRAILEIQSLRKDLPMLTATDIFIFGLCNTAIAAMQQIETLATHSPRIKARLEPSNPVADIIKQVNEETRDAK